MDLNPTSYTGKNNTNPGSGNPVKTARFKIMLTTY